MTSVFDIKQAEWSYRAVVPDVLRTTQLPLPAESARFGRPLQRVPRSAAYWDVAMAGLDFRIEDKLDEPRFNRMLWAGLRGDDVAYPTERHGRDLRRNRRRLLEEYRRRHELESATVASLPSSR